MRKTAQKRHENTGSLVNVRKTNRNDECPCGKSLIMTYRRPDGTIFKEEPQRNKFKNCCMNELGEQSGTIKSTEQLLKARREHIGWPMRDYLNDPKKIEKDFAGESSGEGMGAVPRTFMFDNNRKSRAGRPFIFQRVDKLEGTSLMVLIDAPRRAAETGKIPYEVIKFRTHEQVSNRIEFIPFERNKKVAIEDDIIAHRIVVQKRMFALLDKHEWADNVHPLQKWTTRTRKVVQQ